MFVAVDLGASSTRFVTEVEKVCTLDNNIAILNEDTLTPLEPYDPSIEESLEVFIEKEKTSTIFPVHFLCGNMAARYSSNNDVPSVNSHKYMQPINFIQAILCVAVSKVKFGNDTPVDLYIAVPPVEVNDAKKVFEAELKDSYTVRFPKYGSGAEIKFTVNTVTCCEESVMACTSFFFDTNGRVKPMAKDFLTGTVLSLDIGASTTDLAIVRNGKFLERSGQTYKTGGRVVVDSVSEYITEKFGYEPDRETVDRAIIEGRLQTGNTYIEIGDVVSRAKAELAKQLTRNMETYFKRIGIPMQSIRAVMVSGGGSMRSQYTNKDDEVVATSAPMSDFVTQELQRWSPNTAVIGYGDEARLSNVKGLYIRAMFDQVKQRALQTQAAKKENE